MGWNHQLDKHLFMTPGSMNLLQVKYYSVQWVVIVKDSPHKKAQIIQV